MLDTKKEIELFLLGIAISGNRDKIKEKDKSNIIEDTPIGNVEESNFSVSIKV